MPDIAPADVIDTLSRHLRTKAMKPFVLDMAASRGSTLVDARTGKEYLDFFGFYGSNALGMNHPKLTEDTAFRERLAEVALNKVTNSDIATTHLARFTDTFRRVGIPEHLPYAFFISGGALAIENCLKAAFDWKVRKNFQQGYRREVGHEVLHLDEAFHGRSGYTLSLTNTADARKTKHFPKSDWPRITNPKVTFPLEAHREAVEAHEAEALRQAGRHFHERRDRIAAVIVEPIQGEGGDNHFRPEFLRQLRGITHDNDALLIFDEVQSGVGITGEFWGHQSLGVKPDLLAFGKKSQVCGMLASRTLDEVDGHVFEEGSRISSTWGGNLVDMVRFGRILEVIEEDGLVENARVVGGHLQERLADLAKEQEAVTNTRGRGLMCALDLPSAEVRDRAKKGCLQRGLVMLGCGERSLRFRPPLTITQEEIDRGIGIIEDAVGEAAGETSSAKRAPAALAA
jgi:L-lysine 6-transaminase